MLKGLVGGGAACVRPWGEESSQIGVSRDESVKVSDLMSGPYGWQATVFKLVEGFSGLPAQSVPIHFHRPAKSAHPG